jgi:hypothetical protein
MLPPTSPHKGRQRASKWKSRGRIGFYIQNTTTRLHFLPFLEFQKSQVASMGRFCDAAGLSAHHEYEAEELFETSSSISGDSEDEDQFSDGKCDEALENRFMQQGASQMQQPVRRLNSDSLYDLSPMTTQVPVK